MRTHLLYLSVVSALAGLLSCGCGKNTSSAPAPLSEEQIPLVIAQTFNNSDKETQDQANQYINDVKNHDYPAAFEEVQQLAHRAGLTLDQRATVARALMTTSQKVQEIAANGDDRANQALNSYSSTK
jgi:hypothetical protein